MKKIDATPRGTPAPLFERPQLPEMLFVGAKVLLPYVLASLLLLAGSAVPW
jgi:hypothetical protein